ncbi:T9SS type A sorting domain-containing protein [Flavobacterium sp.]|uniref:T9SS type A sorting domain-containing protein n=1 Tax=Flavobacterium sp. TaxID=239 RepID=UPI003528FCEE
MKKITLFIVAFCCSTSYSQWQSTNTPGGNFDAVYAMEFHGNRLYASKGTPGFIKSDNGGSTWENVGQTEFTTSSIGKYVSHIKSAEDILYVALFNPTYSSSMLYKSTDNGQTFVTDTIALPKTSNNEIVNIDRIYYHNNRIILDVANLGNWSKNVADSEWVRNNNTNTEYADLFGFINGKQFSWGNYHLYKSEDDGETWSQCPDAGVSSFFTTTLLYVDETINRIYVTGRSVTTQQYKMLYSDDEGNTWSELVIAPFLANNWLNMPQTVQAMFAQGDYIQLALENNNTNSEPDILISTNGGETFTPDIVGLDVVQFGTVTARNFIPKDDNLFMCLNFRQIYKKQYSSLSVSDVNSNIPVFSIAPNPVREKLYVNHSERISKSEIFNVNGQLIKHQNSTFENISWSLKGLFILKITDINGNANIQKFLAE